MYQHVKIIPDKTPGKRERIVIIYVFRRQIQ